MPINQLSYNSILTWSEQVAHAGYPNTTWGPYTDQFALNKGNINQSHNNVLALTSGATYTINLNDLTNFVCETFQYVSLFGVIAKVAGSDCTIGGGVNPVDPFGAGVTVTVPAGGMLSWISGSGLTVSGTNLLVTNAGLTNAIVDITLLGQANTVEFMTEDITLENVDSVSMPIGMAAYIFAADECKRAEANSSSTDRAIGLVSQTSIAASASGTVRTGGILTATTGQWDAVAGTSGGLTAGTIYYLSDATAGHLTSTPPSTTGHYVQEIGEAIDSTNILINIKAPILL